ncbi:MAG: CCA tRNA nucleotidyltransferase [Candidatus Nanopelagicales bacterium]
MSTSLQRQALDSLAPVAGLLYELGTLFHNAGHELALVGGPVRDAFLGRTSPLADLDFTTSAEPTQIQRLLDGWAENSWDTGIAFGTISASKNERQIEITTYRSENYNPDSRKPDVEFGSELAADLGRRDFTVNAMALILPTLEFVDLFEGLKDLEKKMLRTPFTPVQSFSDDPLRMLRAARFASQLQFSIATDVIDAMREMAPRLDIVSAERIREELIKIVMSNHPRVGLTVMVETGLAEYVLPELPLLQLEEDEHHHHKDVYEHTLKVLEQAIDLETGHEPQLPGDLILRMAALLHDIGKPKTRKFESDGRVSFHHHEVVGARMTKKRMKSLRFSNEQIDEVSQLVELHLRFHGYGTGEWSDSAVRRYVRDAGPLLSRLHKLTRADSTTRNKRRAEALQKAYDGLEQRIADLQEQEELDSIRPDLNGAQIMEILGIGPGREVGEAYKFLLELRLDQGPLAPQLAQEQLLLWWSERG